ncbi:MAG: B12-binding domain-containing radical SAM protein [Candidatus Omnitrophica bacterium]|nr:B12-binding domain-containing radical SAM protein [Candidatus Omnitrophota bacterium]
MMGKTVLINCPPWGVVMPPLGVAYLSSYLKSKGKEVEIFDLNLDLYKKAGTKQRLFWELDTINKMPPVDIAKNLYKDFKEEIYLFVDKLAPFSIVGFSANNLISTTFAGVVAGMIKIKYPEKIIVLGGPGCFYSWDRKAVPKDAVDFFVIGEGEQVLERFIDYFSNTENPAPQNLKIPGLLHNNTVKKQKFYPAAFVKDLDSIPFPDFKEFDLSQYNYEKKYRPLPMLMSRGCINRCSYCIDWYMCSNFRVRKPENIITEIEHHAKLYGITHIEFNDLLCNGNLTHLEKFCDLLVNSETKIRWISYAAIRKNMSDELLEKIKKSGCNSLCYGIESGSDAVLKRMNKHYNRADASDLIKRTYNAGIEVRMNIIVGFPGESVDDFEQTLEFVRQNRKYITQVTNVSSFVLMPGSDLSVYPHRFGITYRDVTDPGSWRDDLGLTQDIRNKRVSRTCELLETLRIRNLIVNYQKNPCQDLEPLGQKDIVKGRRKEPIEQHREDKGSFRKKNTRKSFFQKTVLVLLFVFSLAMDFYLLILKKLRGSIIFPGN